MGTHARVCTLGEPPLYPTDSPGSAESREARAGLGCTGLRLHSLAVQRGVQSPAESCAEQEVRWTLVLARQGTLPKL